MNKKVSVIIPTYNRSYCILNAINSVLNQSYVDLEVIVVDDGSLDNTKKLIENINSSRINYIYQDNNGVSAARNLGIKHSSGDYIAFLDSDDVWFENKISEQMMFISKNSQYRWVHSNEIWIRNGERVNQKNKHKKSGGDQFLRSVDLCVISPSCVLLEKALLEEMNCFNESYPACEDYDLWLKIASKYEIGYIDKSLIYKYGGHEDQLSKKYKAMDYWRIKSLHWILQNLNP